MLDVYDADTCATWSVKLLKRTLNPHCVMVLAGRLNKRRITAIKKPRTTDKFVKASVVIPNWGVSWNAFKTDRPELNLCKLSSEGT